MVTGALFHQLHPSLKVPVSSKVMWVTGDEGVKPPWFVNEKLFSVTCSIYIFLTLALTTQLLGFIPTHQGSLVLPTFSKKAALWPGTLLISLICEVIFYIISHLRPAPAENLFCFAPWNLIFVDSPRFFRILDILCNNFLKNPTSPTQTLGTAMSLWIFRSWFAWLL